jgi:hypothetical protein
MIDSTKIEVLSKEVRQCAVELEEAAKILKPYGLPSLASIYQKAAERARQTLETVR